MPVIRLLKWERSRDVDCAAVDVGAAVVGSGKVVCGAEDETGAAAVVAVRGGAAEVTAADVDGAGTNAGAGAENNVSGAAWASAAALAKCRKSRAIPKLIPNDCKWVEFNCLDNSTESEMS